MNRHLKSHVKLMGVVTSAFLVFSAAYAQTRSAKRKPVVRKPAAPSPAKPAKTGSETTARAMVNVLRANDAPVGPAGSAQFVEALAPPTTELENQALNRWFQKAQAAARRGLENSFRELTDKKAILNVSVAIRAYYVSRRSTYREDQISQKLAEYDARFEKVTPYFFTPRFRRIMLQPAVLIREYPLADDVLAHDILTIAATVFHDFLWEGANWKEGNPSKALTRLRSLANTDAAANWEEAAGNGGIKNPEFAPWSLLAVDALFVNDVFQEKVFQASFPIAKQELAH